MKRTMRSICSLLFGSLLLAATMSGCASSRQATHEADLLDNKVTAQRVHAALRKAGPEFRHVEVRASKEGITLVGRVKSPEARSRAEEIAKSVNRPMALTNKLEVGGDKTE